MKKRIFSLVISGLLAGGLAWFAIRCLATAYGMSRSPELAPILLALGPLLTLAYAHKRGRLWFWLTLPLLLLPLLYAPLRSALGEVFLQILQRVNHGYQWFYALGPADKELPPVVVTLAMGYLGLVVLWPVCRGLGRGGILLALLPPSLVLGLCFILVDTIPAPEALLPLVGGLLLVLLTSYLRRRQPELLGRVLPTFVLPVALFLAILSNLIPLRTYQPLDLEQVISQRLVALRQAFERTSLPGVLLPLTEPDQADMTTLGDAPESTRTVMTVTSDLGGRIYLRGKAFDRYDGAAWSVVTEGTWDPSLLVWGDRPDDFLQSAQLTVETIGVHDVIYTPYYLTGLPKTGSPVSDVYWENREGQAQYVLRYILNPDSGLAADGEVLQAYEAAVTRENTALPEGTREALIQWWYDHVPPASAVSNPLYQPSANGAPSPAQIALVVSNVAQYDRHPDLFPGGEDFALWFLNEGETGYCAHFAATAAALLRAFGYPARYVTGYVVQARTRGTVDVAIKDAHAWVEYYVEGKGWQVLEATPGLAWGERLPVDPETETALPTETESLPPLPTKNNPEATEETAARPPETTQSPGASGETEASGPRSLPQWLWCFPILLGLALLLWLRRLLVRALFRRRLERSTPNDRLLLLYRRLVRLCKLGKFTLEETCYTLAEKAKFSQFDCTPAEIALVSRAVSDAERQLRGRDILFRLYCKYILAMI